MKRRASSASKRSSHFRDSCVKIQGLRTTVSNYGVERVHYKANLIEATSLTCCSIDSNIKTVNKKIIQKQMQYCVCEGADLLHNCWNFNISIVLGYRYRICFNINGLTARCAELVESLIVLIF
jgi:hypothetical protein